MANIITFHALKSFGCNTVALDNCDIHEIMNIYKSNELDLALQDKYNPKKSHWIISYLDEDIDGIHLKGLYLYFYNHKNNTYNNYIKLCD